MVKEERMRLGSGSASILQGGKTGELRLHRLVDDALYTLISHSSYTLHTLSSHTLTSARVDEVYPGLFICSGVTLCMINCSIVWFLLDFSTYYVNLVRTCRV